MGVERKACGCLVTTDVMGDGNIIIRTDYCKSHEKEIDDK